MQARNIAFYYMIAAMVGGCALNALLRLLPVELVLPSGMVAGLVFVLATTVALYLTLARWDRQRSHTEESLRDLGRTDPLTGLLNRAAFAGKVTQALARTKRGQGSLGLLFLDLDGFKEINDGYGHEIGDLILREVAVRLTVGLRETDAAGRYGGDEFLLLLESANQDCGCLAAAERVVKRLRHPFHLNGQEFLLSVSVGIAQYPEDGGTPEDLLRHADQAMYIVKSEGKNGFRRHVPGMSALPNQSSVSASRTICPVWFRDSYG